MRLTQNDLIAQLSTIVDSAFARDAVLSYIEMEQRFLSGDWQHTELDAGRLCEAVSRALLQVDTGKITHKDLPNAIQAILLDTNRSHTLDWKDRYHVAKAIEVIYKFRSDRGAVHISPTHSADYMDSMLALHVGKWILAEFLRLVWNQDKEVIAEVIEQMVQMEHSLVHVLEGKPLVMAKVSAPEEILVLLNNVDGNRLSRSDLRTFAHHKSANVNTAISRLIADKYIRAIGDEVALTPNGQKRVREVIVPKLKAQK